MGLLIIEIFENGQNKISKKTKQTKQTKTSKTNQTNQTNQQPLSKQTTTQKKTKKYEDIAKLRIEIVLIIICKLYLSRIPSNYGINKTKTKQK
jgi:hypothetical protein